MSDKTPAAAMPAAEAGSNLPEFTVTELSTALKRTIEDAFGNVRVRGEISGFKRAASGHLYFTLKDADAVLDAVCWRGVAGRLSIAPEDGLEVVATGRVTTYAGRSKYQVVVESLELAGEGALLKLLEERRKKLAAEGLFDDERKRALPFLPEVIGVVTSPTGAVIRDILHRLRERFPRHVLIWPVLVQGEGAAEQIAAAIRGFNGLARGGTVPRPDLLIVARGGGSLEDLWAFNEEIVVRAAAASEIPLISAVGHETDTTLIDFAADRRAPTPTAAAEIAVPVRADLLNQVIDDGRRLLAGMTRNVEDRRVRLEGLARGLPDARRVLEDKTQRLDDRGERLAYAVTTLFERRRGRLAELAARLRHPRQQLAEIGNRLTAAARALDVVAGVRLREGRARLEAAGARLRLRPIAAEIERSTRTLSDFEARLGAAARRHLTDGTVRVEALAGRLDVLSYRNTLKRGFALVRDAAGGAVTDSAALTAGMSVSIEFRDGRAGATIDESTDVNRSQKKPVSRSRRDSGKTSADQDQGTLL